MDWQAPATDAYAPTDSGGWKAPEGDPVAPGLLESFGRGAANNFPLAPQAIAALKSGEYSKNLEDWNTSAATAKKANPISYGAGAVTGAVAPLAIPGVGEAAEAAPIATNAALGGAEAISNKDLTKDPLETLKEAGEGAAVGGATAGVLGKVLPEASTLENASDRTAVKSLNMPSGILVDMTPEERSSLAQFAHENNLVGSNKEDVLEKARQLSDSYGSKIGEIANKTEGMGLRVDPNDHYQAMQGLLDKSEQFAGKKNLEMRKIGRDLTNGADDILSLPANPTWSDIQNLKEAYGKAAFKPTGEVKSEGAKETYFALKDMLKGIADKAQKDPSLPGDYKEALAGYSRMHPIVSGLEKAVDADLRGGGGPAGARGIMGLIRQMPGPARAVAGVAGAVTGHPYIAGAAALPEIMDPAIQSRVARGAAKALPYAKQGMTQELMDYINSKTKKEPRQ